MYTEHSKHSSNTKAKTTRVKDFYIYMIRSDSRITLVRLWYRTYVVRMSEQKACRTIVRPVCTQTSCGVDTRFDWKEQNKPAVAGVVGVVVVTAVP